MDQNPYSPPAAPINVVAPPAEPVGVFISTSRLARAIAWAIAFVCAGQGANAIYKAFVILLIRHYLAIGRSTEALLRGIGTLDFFGEGLMSLSLLPVWILWCYFMARANRNARALGAVALQYTPRWAAGIVFVPIVGLYAPYRAMKEIWQASSPDRSLRLLIWWWGLYVIWTLSGVLFMPFTNGAHGADGAMLRAGRDMVTSLLCIAAGVALALIVTTVARFQDASRDRLLKE